MKPCMKPVRKGDIAPALISPWLQKTVHPDQQAVSVLKALSCSGCFNVASQISGLFARDSTRAIDPPGRDYMDNTFIHEFFIL